jgi:hypothetical protein
VPLGVVASLEMKEGTTLGARAQWAILRAAVLYKPRLATCNFFNAVNQNLSYSNKLKMINLVVFFFMALTFDVCQCL